MARIDRPYDTSYLLVVCSNNVSVLHYFFDATTFTGYVTARRGRTRNIEKSFIFRKHLRMKTTETFSFMYTHNVVNVWDIH